MGQLTPRLKYWLTSMRKLRNSAINKWADMNKVRHPELVLCVLMWLPRILLNKSQCQKEDYQCCLKEEEYEHWCEEERYEREQAELCWNCLFFRHCWNECLKLPTRHNCLECSNQYSEFRQSQANRWSILERLSYQSNNMDRCVKNEGAHDRLGKRAYD